MGGNCAIYLITLGHCHMENQIFFPRDTALT